MENPFRFPTFLFTSQSFLNTIVFVPCDFISSSSLSPFTFMVRPLSSFSQARELKQWYVIFCEARLLNKRKNRICMGLMP